MKIGGKLQNKILILLAIVFMVFIMFKLLTISKSRDLAEQVLNRENMQVIVYVKEGCIYCMMAKDLLVENKIIYETIELASNPALQKKLIEKTRKIVKIINLSTKTAILICKFYLSVKMHWTFSVG